MLDTTRIFNFKDYWKAVTYIEKLNDELKSKRWEIFYSQLLDYLERKKWLRHNEDGEYRITEHFKSKVYHYYTSPNFDIEDHIKTFGTNFPRFISSLISVTIFISFFPNPSILENPMADFLHENNCSIYRGMEILHNLFHALYIKDREKHIDWEKTLHYPSNIPQCFLNLFLIKFKPNSIRGVFIYFRQKEWYEVY